MRQLKDRVAVVTGSASGIGFGIAKRFLEEGMKVVLADRDEATLAIALSELEPLGDVIAKPTDVANPASVQNLADHALARFGAAHVLLNNAGVGGFQRFETTSVEHWQWTLGVNLMGVVHGIKSFLPILAAQDEAHIVNTASISGFLYMANLHPYNASKAAVVALTEGLFFEFQTEHPNIGISVLAPGSTATNISNDERNAPAGLVSRSEADPEAEPIRKLIADANAAGKTGYEVAGYVVEGIRENKLHIWSHPEWLGPVKDRAEAIYAGRPIVSPLGATE